MKAQRRHDLKENDLAHVLEVSRRYLDEHGRRVAFAAVIVVAVVAVTALTVRSQTAATDDRWRRLTELRYEDVEVGRDSIAVLTALAEQSSDERFVLKCLVEQGKQALRLALKVPAAPDPELNAIARRSYGELLTRFPSTALAVGLAHLGLATVEENAFVIDGESGHKKAARKHLSAVIDNPALDALPFKRMAMDRMASIDDTFTRIRFDETLPEEEAPVDEPANADPVDTP